jgi:sugar O-acyltransferase (sialic acid O-acetyltransferase NeuD family)
MKKKINEKVCIFGTGGFGRESLCCLIDILNAENKNIKDYGLFVVDDGYFKEKEILGIKVIPFSEFNPANYLAFIAVGDPFARKIIYDKFPKKTKFATLIHPSAILSDWIHLEEGTIVTAGTILTCNIKIGKQAHLNLHTTVGHDCIIGDFFTSAPAVNISGSCNFGNNITIGTNASIKNGISICDNVVLGMGSVVVKNISETGIYVGNPAKFIKNIPF